MWMAPDAVSMQRSTPAEWALVAAWVALLAGMLYALAVGDRALGQWLAYAVLGLAIVSVLVQYRRRKRR